MTVEDAKPRLESANSYAAAFRCLLEEDRALTLPQLARRLAAPAWIVGPTFSNLRMLGLLDWRNGDGLTRYSLSPWSRHRQGALLEILIDAERTPGAPVDREGLRPAIELALRQRPGMILVYGNDGTLRSDFDFKGCRDVYGRPRWLPPNESPPLLDVSAEELGLVRRILDEIARAEDLLTTDAEFAAADGSGGQRVFEERRAHHLRFRPVDRASGTPVKDPPRSVDDDLERETRRTLLAARVRRRLDVEIGPRWAVRATPAIVSIDVFPATHHKGLARDHLLAGDGIGGRRQLVSFGDRLDGNDAPLVETPLPGAEDRYAFLSVAKRPPELQRRLDSGRLDPRILVAHVGEGCGSTIALLNRVLRLRSKGLAAKDALTRALREVQDAMFWRRNADVAEQIARRWAADQPLTLAFDIDGTINVQDGQPVHADIPPIMKELDSWGFQLAVITGKKLDRVRRENLLGIAEVIDAAPEEQS